MSADKNEEAVEDEKDDILTKIDNAIAKYYSRMNVQNYRNDNGDGKFRLYCEENGFEPKDIQEELSQSPQDCMLIDFDPNFPLYDPDTFKQQQRRAKEIFRILTYAAEKGRPPPPRNTFNFEIPPKERTSLEHEYKEQLPALAKIGAKEPDLWYFLALGRHPSNNNIPFLTNMVDLYTRDKTDIFCSTQPQKGLTVEDWCTNYNTFMMDLKSTNVRRAEKLKTAMISYSNRIMCRLQFTPTYRIIDNIHEISTYIVSVPLFIQKLIDVGFAVPFGVDLLIAVRDVEGCTDTVGDDEKGNNNDDDDDDDTYNNMDISGTTATDSKHIGSIEDIQKRLKGAKSKYFGPELVNKEQFDKLDQDTRFLMNTYKQFRNLLSGTKDDDSGDEDNHSGKQHDAQHDAPKRSSYYPQRKRFEIFVDRRADKYKNDTNKNNDIMQDMKDEILFFEPPKNCDTLPKNHVAEWFMEAARTCLIPSEDYNVEQKQYGQKSTITAKDHLYGELLTFSYNVNQENEIKCYIIWNGQTMRFHGDYIKKILPLLFVESIENKTFIQGKEVQKVQADFDKVMPDPNFDNFRSQYG